MKSSSRDVWPEVAIFKLFKITLRDQNSIILSFCDKNDSFCYISTWGFNPATSITLTSADVDGVHFGQNALTANWAELEKICNRKKWSQFHALYKGEKISENKILKIISILRKIVRLIVRDLILRKLAPKLQESRWNLFLFSKHGNYEKTSVFF